MNSNTMDIRDVPQVLKLVESMMTLAVEHFKLQAQISGCTGNDAVARALTIGVNALRECRESVAENVEGRQ